MNMEVGKTSVFEGHHSDWISYIEDERKSHNHEKKSWVVYLPQGKDHIFSPIYNFALLHAMTDQNLKVHRGHGVIVAPEQEVGYHDHGDLFTFLYYIDPGDAFAPLYLEDREIVPESGLYISIEQRVKHGVRKNLGQKDRYSLAILMEVDNAS